MKSNMKQSIQKTNLAHFKILKDNKHGYGTNSHCVY